MRHGRLSSILLLVMAASVAAVGGCSDDDNGAEPQGFTLADFAGTWDVTSYRVTHDTMPQMTVDLVQEGVSMFFIATATGAFTGEMEAPDPQSQQLVTIPFAGTFVLEDQTTVTVTFIPEIPQYLTGFTGSFTFEDDTITMTDEDGTFDFDGDGTDEPVTAVVELVRR